MGRSNDHPPRRVRNRRDKREERCGEMMWEVDKREKRSDDKTWKEEKIEKKKEGNRIEKREEKEFGKDEKRVYVVTNSELWL